MNQPGDSGSGLMNQPGDEIGDFALQEAPGVSF